MSRHEGPARTFAPPKLPATLRLGAVVVFVSAGGYHHHLGFNIWRGEGVPPVPKGRVGLRHWTVVLDDPEEVEAVRERGIRDDDIPMRLATYDSAPLRL